MIAIHELKHLSISQNMLTINLANHHFYRQIYY